MPQPLQNPPEHSDSESFAHLYGELQKIAHRQLRVLKPGDTLDTLSLVHEAYLKLEKHPSQVWNDKKHFLSTASRAMRQILVDYARKLNASKRGGNARKESLDSVSPPTVQIDAQPMEILDLENALEQLFVLNERQGTVIELRFFGGLSIEETARILSVTPRTIDRDLFKAKAFLYQILHIGNR